MFCEANIQRKFWPLLSQEIIFKELTQILDDWQFRQSVATLTHFPTKQFYLSIDIKAKVNYCLMEQINGLMQISHNTFITTNNFLRKYPNIGGLTLSTKCCDTEQLAHFPIKQFYLSTIMVKVKLLFNTTNKWLNCTKHNFLKKIH